MPDSRILNTMDRKAPERIEEERGAWKLLYFMGFVFLVFLLTYVGLAFGYRNFLGARIKVVEQNITALASENPASSKQDEFLIFQAQLANLKNLLNKRESATKVFGLLEAHTNTRIYYTNLSFSLPERRLELQGVAPSYDVLAEQLAAYTAMKEVVRYEVSSARVKDGGVVSFSVVIYLNPVTLTL